MPALSKAHEILLSSEAVHVFPHRSWLLVLFLSRVKLHRLPRRCGQCPVPAHSLVAAATSGVRNAAASCPPPLALSLALEVDCWHEFQVWDCKPQSWLVLPLVLVLALAMASQCTYLWSLSPQPQLIPPIHLKRGDISICELMELEGPCTNDLLPLWQAQAFSLTPSTMSYLPP